MDLTIILRDINEYKSEKSREERLTEYINERLRKAINTYYTELESHLEYAISRTNSSRNEIKILKQLGNGSHRIN